MGNESNGNLNLKRLYTVIFTGGSEFEIQIPFSGSVYHNGRQSLHHIYCDEETLKQLHTLGAEKVQIRSEGENEEQKKERETLHQQDLEKVFPTAKCAGCLWFDLSTENLCGAVDWEDERKKAVLSLHKKALIDLNQCPIFPISPS